MKELPIVPTNFRKVFGLTKPYVKRFVNRALTPVVDIHYADVQK